MLIETGILIVPFVLFLLGIKLFKWVGLVPLIIGNGL